MKLFFERLSYFLPIPILIILFNYFEDPANLFNEKYERGIVNYLVKGYNVTNVVNYNERLLQKFFIEKMAKCPTEIVLGSSRILLINSALAKNMNLINNGVSGATLEDDLAIYYLYEKKGCNIQKVIIGLDPWLLNDNHNQSRWQSLENEYAVFLSKILKNTAKNIHKSRFQGYEKYAELFSFSYFKTSVSYFLRGINKKYIPTKKILNDGLTRLSDGSVSYDIPYRNASPKEVDTKAKNIIETIPIYSLGDYTHLSEHYKLIFSRFIEYLQKKNIQVEFFLSPYHPIVYEYYEKKTYYKIVFETENYFLNYATAHQIKVYGSYNPKKYNFDNSYFYDGLHCNQKAIEKIFENDSE